MAVNWSAPETRTSTIQRAAAREMFSPSKTTSMSEDFCQSKDVVRNRAFICATSDVVSPSTAPGAKPAS